MTAPDPTVAERVLQAAANWVRLPPGSRYWQPSEHDYLITFFPPHMGVGTHVTWCRSERPAADLVDEAARVARDGGAAALDFWLAPTTAPADLVEVVATRGGHLLESTELLAADLSGEAYDPGPPPALATVDGVRAEVSVALVDDEAGLRGVAEVNADGSDRYPPAEVLAAQVAALTAPVSDGAEFWVLARVDGVPAACGSCSISAGVARLGGGSTRVRFRRHGLYRAVLAHRITVARQHGATLALVKAKPATSGPILARVGFRPYGEEQLWRLPLAGETVGGPG